jgi:hypothetical protein
MPTGKSVPARRVWSFLDYIPGLSVTDPEDPDVAKEPVMSQRVGFFGDDVIESGVDNKARDRFYETRFRPKSFLANFHLFVTDKVSSKIYARIKKHPRTQLFETMAPQRAKKEIL